jgi:hypothetical protein
MAIVEANENYGGMIWIISRFRSSRMCYDSMSKIFFETKDNSSPQYSNHLLFGPIAYRKKANLFMKKKLICEMKRKFIYLFILIIIMFLLFDSPQNITITSLVISILNFLRTFH